VVATIFRTASGDGERVIAGPRGRIVKVDVEKLKAGGGIAARPAVAPAPPPTESSDVTAAPLFRQRTDIPKDAARGAPAGIPAVIPIVRAPDDPGIDEEPVGDEFTEPVNSVQSQAGGWRGFLSRWGG